MFFYNDTATTEIYTYCTLFPYTTLFRSRGDHRVADPLQPSRQHPVLARRQCFAFRACPGFAVSVAVAPVIDERRLLHHLQSGPCRGQVLADALGVSRAAIWKRVQALRAAGLEISADRRCGYALGSPLELLDAATIRGLLQHAIDAALPALGVCWSLDSTQGAEVHRDARTEEHTS